MSISPITSPSLLSASPAQNIFRQPRSEFRQLAQALQSGDLNAAQTAFSALTNGSNATSNNSSPFARDMNAIGQALQSGDVSGAQQAFAQLQKDFKAPATPNQPAQGTQGTHHGRHHHGHHHADADDASTATGAPLNQPTGTAATGSLLNLTA